MAQSHMMPGKGGKPPFRMAGPPMGKPKPKKKAAAKRRPPPFKKGKRY